jgi:hypothetical protein
MPTIVTPRGEAVTPPPIKRQKPYLTLPELRGLRCRTWSMLQALGLTVPQIARTYNVSESTVSADLKWLRDERRAGRPVPRFPNEPGHDEPDPELDDKL